MEEQYAHAEERRLTVEEYRAGEHIEKDIENDIREIVQRSMEKAVADEIFEKVKSEKLATETPTVQPKFKADVSKKLGKLNSFLLSSKEESSLFRTDGTDFNLYPSN